MRTEIHQQVILETHVSAKTIDHANEEFSEGRPFRGQKRPAAYCGS
jgi:hypothetical protein